MYCVVGFTRGDAIVTAKKAIGDELMRIAPALGRLKARSKGWTRLRRFGFVQMSSEQAQLIALQAHRDALTWALGIVSWRSEKEDRPGAGMPINLALRKLMERDEQGALDAIHALKEQMFRDEGEP